MHFDTKERVAASVTLYNSLPSCIDAIATYQDQVEQIYLIDNSEHPNSDLISELTKWPNVYYTHSGENQGVAAALNIAAQLAIDSGFKFLLTMDDDTHLPLNAVRTMVEIIFAHDESERIGIISGVHSIFKHSDDPKNVLHTMTSGNLLNLSVYAQVGPFRDDFFIDHIDHEYCLRLNQLGYLVIQVPKIILQHQLGERKFSGWGTYKFTSHTPIRGYYMIRNGFIVANMYPIFRSQAFILIIKEYLKVILFEDKKMYRLKLMYHGLKDALDKRLGKFYQQS